MALYDRLINTGHISKNSNVNGHMLCDINSDISLEFGNWLPNHYTQRICAVRLSLADHPLQERIIRSAVLVIPIVMKRRKQSIILYPSAFQSYN
jgi:hypothetical protein